LPVGAEAIREGWSKIGLMLESQKRGEQNAIATACGSDDYISSAWTWAPASRLPQARTSAQKNHDEPKALPSKIDGQPVSASQTHR
jgi:hypothetical protein